MIIVKQLFCSVPWLKFSIFALKLLPLGENWRENMLEEIKFIKCKSFTEYSD